MKRALMSLLVAVIAVTAYSQTILGKWITEGGDSNVELFQVGDKLNGKIVWLRAGEGTLDKKNQNKSLRNRKLMGVNVLTGLVKKGERWEGGQVYNPKNGKTYKCSIWLEDGNLKVRGYLGMFYETQTWIRK